MGAAADLVREIVAGGALTDSAWRAAFQEVPRELFVPYYYASRAGGGQERLWRDDPDPRRRERWLEGVYDDMPLATRMRDGELISSSSQPSLMARMLEALDVRDGMTVLEIGTGTGYNAALLAHRLSGERVTTMDLDPDITESAQRHLTEAGYRPRVVTGNGALGCPAHAPYDRIIATCALPEVPPAWLPQCTEGALVLLPLATGLLSLRVTDGAHASGHFLATPAFFVPLRGGTPARGSPGMPGPETKVPRWVRRDDSFRFLLALSGGRLGAHEAYTLWHEAGRPERQRYGVTVRGAEQWGWLDDPGGEHVWPLGERGAAEARGT